MLRTFDAVVAGEAEDAISAVNVANSDEEYLSSFHCFEIELACDGFLPTRHDFRGLESRTDGLDGVAMRQRDFVHVRRFRPADLEYSDPFAVPSH